MNNNQVTIEDYFERYNINYNLQDVDLQDDEDDFFDDMEEFSDYPEELSKPDEFLKERVIREIIYDRLRENLVATFHHHRPYPEEPEDVIEMALNFQDRLEKLFEEQIQLSDEIGIGITKFAHQKLFRSQIFEEIIQTALHPSRIQKQLNQFDDVESFFDAISC